MSLSPRLLLPGTCLLCDLTLSHTADIDLCPDCLGALPWNRPACPRCAAPGGFGVGAPGIEVCPACEQRPPPFLRTLAPLRYEGHPRGWVRRLKGHQGLVEGRVLGTLLAQAAAEWYAPHPDGATPPRRPDLLLPVPVSAWRLAWRGHNQALTLARPVARRLDVPALRHAARRLPGGRPQRTLGRAARLGNPHGRFTCDRRWPEPGPCVAIVDDVMTTGATAAEVARLLRAAGVAEVHVLCATRTPRP